MRGGGYDESFERWGNLRGPEAVTARLQAIETRLEQLRRELVEVGRWADHPASPELGSSLKRVRELLEDMSRQVRHARERRRHG
ncbi:MAG: hypothetical protein M3075_00465 [Candidatus Dormibacteraeota bacterium]|jgi:hypothetical protein|nr:hypothetical protein [Candidatus Dormibacteraeota bacterium]